MMPYMLLLLVVVQGVAATSGRETTPPATSTTTPVQQSGTKLIDEEFNTDPAEDEHLTWKLKSESGYYSKAVGACPKTASGHAGPHYDSCLHLGMSYCDDGSCFRNEFGLDGNVPIFELGKEYWIGISIYRPAPYESDPTKTVNFQIKSAGGKSFSPGGPLLSLLDMHGHWGIAARGAQHCGKKNCDIESGIIQYIAPVIEDTWVDFVLRVKLSTSWKDPASITVYMDGQKVWDESNLLIGYGDDTYGMYFKWGLYKSSWKKKKSKTESTTTQVSSIISAVRVYEGTGLYLMADTSPVLCSTPEDCCLAASCPIKKSSLKDFSGSRCRELCAMDTSNQVCKTFQEHTCNSARVCCARCHKGEPSWRFSEDSCQAYCRKADALGLRRRKYCNSPSGLSTGCISGDVPCDTSTGAACSHSGPSFRCKCPPNHYIRNFDGTTCLERGS